MFSPVSLISSKWYSFASFLKWELRFSHIQIFESVSWCCMKTCEMYHLCIEGWHSFHNVVPGRWCSTRDRCDPHPGSCSSSALDRCTPWESTWDGQTERYSQTVSAQRALPQKRKHRLWGQSADSQLIRSHPHHINRVALGARFLQCPHFIISKIWFN